MNRDPRVTLANGPMTLGQIVVVAVTVALNALDGFDVLSISFAAPGIAREWGMNSAGLGVVLSMELLGMALGSILLGGAADRYGRRRTVLSCLGGMAVGMTMTANAHGVVELCTWRVLTGIGIGGMLASSSAVAAEFASSKRRSLCVSLMVIGYPLGVIVGGSIVAVLLHRHDWRVVFEVGAVMTALFVPVVIWLVPESVTWLCETQPTGALETVNSSLRKLGYEAITALPAATQRSQYGSLVEILRRDRVRVTILVTLTYLLHITTFYFMIKWIPKIVVDTGSTAATAAGVLVWTNVGVAIGGIALGVLAYRIGLKIVTIAMCIASAVTVNVFGHGHASIHALVLVCVLAGFSTGGGVAGIYAVLAQVFPAKMRAAGTGFAIGMGRGGAVVSPIVAGYLFQGGCGLQTVALIMSAGSLLAAALLVLVRLEPRPAIPR